MFKNDYLGKHVHTAASDILRRGIFCKVHIEEVHSFLQHFDIHLFQIDFRVLHNLRGVFTFCAGSNPAHGVSEIRDGEDLWQWSRLEIRLNAFRRSTIPQK